MKAQKGTLIAHGTPGWHSFVFCGLWFMGSVAVQARANHLPSEQGGPKWRGSIQQCHVCTPGYCWKERRRGIAQEPPRVPSL